MTKKELRVIYREKRKALTTTERIKLDDLLLIQFQKAGLPFIETLFSFWPVEASGEPNTHLFTDFLEFSNPGLLVAYPQSDFISNKMTAIISGEQTSFIKNAYHIYEPSAGDIVTPEELDMIFVPLLAFDRYGYRVGYGKGFYDKYLVHCRKDCIKVGFSYFEPVDEITDKHQFDVPLSLCITPQNSYVF